MIEQPTEQETLELMSAVLGVSLAQAAEILAIERGETNGDVIEVEADLPEK